MVLCFCDVCVMMCECCVCVVWLWGVCVCEMMVVVMFGMFLVLGCVGVFCGVSVWCVLL